MAFFIGMIATPAHADEIAIGIAGQNVITPVAQNSFSEGTDIQLAYRWDRIDGLGAIGKPSPYVLGSISIDGEASFAAAGLSWKIGDKIYVRPGIGIAVHDDPKLEFAPDGSQTQLGSRVFCARISDWRAPFQTHRSRSQLGSSQSCADIQQRAESRSR